MQEFKWFMIFLATAAICLAVGVSIDTHYQTQCKIAGLEAGKNDIEISNICGKL